MRGRVYRSTQGTVRRAEGRAWRGAKIGCEGVRRIGSAGMLGKGLKECGREGGAV